MQKKKKTQRDFIRKTQSDFIRQFPITTPAKEVVEKGKQAGFFFKCSAVYDTRRTDRQAMAKSAAAHNAVLDQIKTRGKKLKLKKKLDNAPLQFGDMPPQDQEDEFFFLQAVSRIGLVKAEALIDEARRRFIRIPLGV